MIIVQISWNLCFWVLMLSFGIHIKHKIADSMSSEHVETFFWKCLGCKSIQITNGNFPPVPCNECSSDHWKFLRRARLSLKKYEIMASKDFFQEIQQKNKTDHNKLWTFRKTEN